MNTFKDYDLNDRKDEVIKMIAEAAQDNPKMVDSIFGKAIVDEATKIYKLTK